MPGAGNGRCDRAGRDLPDHRFSAQQLPVLRPRELRPVHAVPRRDPLGVVDGRTNPGGPRAAERPGACWRRSATRSGSCPARRSAAWPTVPPGRSRRPSASFEESSRTTSGGRTQRATRTSVRRWPWRRAQHIEGAEPDRPRDDWTARPMPIITVDGIKIELRSDERLNAIEAAARAGVEIPHYCWHPGLSVVGSCRMCLVEVGAYDASGKVSMGPRAGAGLQHAGAGRDGDRDAEREGPAGPGDGRGGSAAGPSGGLLDLRQGGRVPSAGLLFQVRAGGGAEGGHQAVHQPPARPGGRDVLRRPLHPVQPVRAVHAGDFGDERAAGPRAGGPRGDRRSGGFPVEQQAVGQRGGPVPGGGVVRQGFSLQAAGVVHASPRRGVHALRDGLFDLGGGDARSHPADQAPGEPAGESLVDLQRRPLRLSPRAQPGADRRRPAPARGGERRSWISRGWRSGCGRLCGEPGDGWERCCRPS